MRKMITGLVATALLVSGCSGPEDADHNRWTQPLTAAELETYAGIHLPAGTVMLSTAYEHFTDWRLTASFRFPGTALPDFLRTGGFDEPTPGLRAVTDTEASSNKTWQPDAATTVSGVDETHDDDATMAVCRKLLLDQSKVGEVTVYLVAFGF